jgi:hypothetical protein
MLFNPDWRKKVGSAFTKIIYEIAMTGKVG